MSKSKSTIVEVDVMPFRSVEVDSYHSGTCQCPSDPTLVDEMRS